eukprot:scaffold31046_cov157-Amphora_coffeaeformis.AAC.1
MQNESSFAAPVKCRSGSHHRETDILFTTVRCSSRLDVNSILETPASSFECELPQNGRVVSFGFVEIHEHGVILGDNPAVSRGPPVSIGLNNAPESRRYMNTKNTETRVAFGMAAK